MRITLTMQQDTAIRNINQQQENIDRLTKAASSGVKLTSASDDPTAWAQALDLKAGLRDYDSISKNIDFATGWNQATESSLNQLSDLISQARQIGIRAQNPGTDDTRTALVQQMDGIIKQAISVAGAQYEDRYMFSGQADTAPFTLDDATGDVTVNGDDGEISIRRDRLGSDFFKVNVTGNEVFTFDYNSTNLNILHELWEMKGAIQSGNSDLIGQKLDTLQSAFDHVGSMLTLTGAKLSSLQDQSTALSYIIDNNKTQLSNVEDADMAETLTNLQQSQTAFQAALKVTASLQSLNLAQYL